MANPYSKTETNSLVKAYFKMFQAELNGEKYNKSVTRRELAAKTGRSEASIEIKMQNVSAVLDELGFPYIKGYKPMRNYQRALIDAVTENLETINIKPIK